MITRDDLDRAERCTAGDGCPAHPDVHAIHNPLMDVDAQGELASAAILYEALERAIPESWDGEDSWVSIAAAWIEHMATTHGVQCAGPQCLATADTPAYVGALRRMWRDSEPIEVYAPDHTNRTLGYREAIRDLAHELSVDLDSDA